MFCFNTLWVLLDQNGVPCPKLKELNFSLSLMGACTNPWFEIILWNYLYALCYKIENNDRLCHLSIVIWKWIGTTQVKGLNIINLTSHDLIIEIVQNSFNYNSYVSCINILYWKRIWNIDWLEDVKFVWHLFIHKFLLHLTTHLFVYQWCSQHMISVHKMYEPMNEWTSHNFHY
jgi:hypothetical protein